MHSHGGEIYQQHYELDYSVNVNAMGTPRSVIEAAARGAELSAQYPDVHCTELRKELAACWDIPENWLIFGNGAADLIFSVVLYAKPKKILLLAPTFAEYEQASKIINTEIVYYELKEENDFKVDSGILQALTPDIDMMFLCNPNNPTGQAVPREFMIEILNKCKESNILAVVDECFNEFLENPQDYTVRDQVGNYENLFILKAFTKTYAMAGLRLGYAICANQQIVEGMKETNQPWAVSIPAQFAGVAALKEVDYVKESMQLLQQERAFLKEALKKLGFKVFDSQANYIFFKAEPSLYEECRKRKILIRNCNNYKGLTDGYFRISVKLPEENRKLVKIMEEIING
jgi:threonine-phosphate decarboxylase